MSISKKCRKCEKVKDISEFYKHSKMSDGYLNSCKSCVKQKSLQNRHDNIEYYREYDRNRPNKEERNLKQKEYSLTEKGKLVHNKAVSNYRQKHSLIYKAHNSVNNSLRDNKIIKPLLCETCNQEKQLEAHHCDYALPLYIMWLCVDCHKDWHKNNIPLNAH